MPTELVHYAALDGVATITLDSPHNRNALSRQLVSELSAHLTAAAADESVRAIVLTSADRVFCSGADLSEASTTPMLEGARAIVALQRLILELPTPVVVALRGPVRAGGTGLVAAADIVIASDAANFQLTEVKLGLAAAAISLTVLPRMTSRAAGLTFLSGAKFGATEAAAYGLVTRVVPADTLDAAVSEVVAELITGALQGLRETKGLLNASILAGFDARGEEVAALSARLFDSPEAHEAMTAFLSR
ncbi:enoyl-CoA hydratase-related protein [Nocardioides sp.]|uniref:enoyl-CoA hydratase-related protein n=1 Tax=Nocardioides sp. TaxID=35761 RepID=UPI0026375FEA|nr:enoyl-CoA hydratase-related protein [Nocardioides sp.]